MRVELPDGAWAELAEPRKVTARRRKPVHAAFEVATRATTAASGVLNGTEAFYEALAVALTDAWSFAEPVSVDALQDLPGDVHDALVDACRPFEDDLLPDFGVSADPKADTGGSSS